MSEGMDLRIYRRGKILSHHRLEFRFYLSFSALVFLSSLPTFLSTVFRLSSTANQWKFISSVQFTFLILHEDLNRRNLKHNPDVRFVNESGHNIRDLNLKVFNETLILFRKEALSSHNIVRCKFCSALNRNEELKNIRTALHWTIWYAMIFIYCNWVSTRWQRSVNWYENSKEIAVYKRRNNTQNNAKSQNAQNRKQTCKTRT